MFYPDSIRRAPGNDGGDAVEALEQRTAEIRRMMREITRPVGIESDADRDSRQKEREIIERVLQEREQGIETSPEEAIVALELIVTTIDADRGKNISNARAAEMMKHIRRLRGILGLSQ